MHERTPSNGYRLKQTRIMSFPKDQAAKTASDTAFMILFTVCFCHFLNDTMQSMLPAIYPMLKSHFDLSFAQIGLLTLNLQVTSSVIQPLVGIYADKHHHKWQLAVGMLFTFTGIFILSMATSYAMVMLAVALMGCGSSIFHPQASQVAQVAAGSRKGLAQSIFQVGGNGGYAIGPLLAALIIIPHGLHAVRWFAIIAVVASSVLYYVGRWHIKALANHRKVNAVAWSTAKTYTMTWKIIFVVLLFILMFSKNFFTASMTNYYTFFLIDKFGVAVQTSQYCLFIFLASQVVGTLVGGWVGDKYGRKSVILFSIFGAAPFTIALPYLTSLWATIALSMVIGMVMASAFSAILVFATDLMPHHTGIVAGLFYGLSFGAAGVGSALFGHIADTWGIDSVLKISTWLPLIGIGALLLPKMNKERNNQAMREQTRLEHPTT